MDDSSEKESLENMLFKIQTELEESFNLIDSNTQEIKFIVIDRTSDKTVYHFLMNIKYIATSKERNDE
jgi:hypothetical protein